ncbi:hypothetical protein [Spongorhabdus nitratireducens]
MLTTRLNPVSQEKELMVVMAYDVNQKALRLPGGVMKPADGVHVNTAAREMLEELKLNFNVKDLTNLNRTYTYDDHTVYVVGDDTCHGLFFLDGVHTPDPDYLFPEKFEKLSLDRRIKQAQARFPMNAANHELHEIKQVCLVEVKKIHRWIMTNNLQDSRLYPVGQPVIIVDQDNPAKKYKLDYQFLWVLSQAFMIESPACSALCMLDLMSDDKTRKTVDKVLATQFRVSQDKVLGAPKKNIRKKRATSGTGGACSDYSTGVKTRVFDYRIIPSAFSDFYSLIDVFQSRQAIFHNDEYYFQNVFPGGNCLYLAYLSGWLHALVYDVASGRNPLAIEDEIGKLINERSEFRQYLVEPNSQAVGLEDTTDAFVAFLLELNQVPTMSHLHQMIMPDHFVQIRLDRKTEWAWGGKEKVLEPLVRYFRNYAVFLRRQDMLNEPDRHSVMLTAGFYPEYYQCAGAVKNFAEYYEDLNLNPIDQFWYFQSQSGVWATDLEMQMLYNIRPFSLCYHECHEAWDAHCETRQGFKPGMYPEGSDIVIFHQKNHFDVLIPKKMFISGS